VSAGLDPLRPHRGKLLGLAYRMLGSRSDAEDVLQDAFVRFHGATGIANAEAYLMTIVTRLCLDRLKRARARREIYVGTWLPEPVVDPEALSPHTAAELADDLSFALLLALERLSPGERAAFLLHDIFEMDYPQVAAMLDRSEAACRQLASRARKSVRSARPSALPVSAEDHGRLVAAFGKAISDGDEAGLALLLRDDAIYFADGGGARPAALNPIYGPAKIARFFIRAKRKNPWDSADFRPVYRAINGAFGMLVYRDGVVDQVFSMVMENGRIAALYLVSNPEKVRHLN
jgi:RNA polymerase sigma-70 factor (ECF subfamily)